MAYPDPINPEASLAELHQVESACIRKLNQKDLEPIVRESCLQNLAEVRKKLKDIRKAAHSGQVIRLI